MSTLKLTDLEFLRDAYEDYTEDCADALDKALTSINIMDRYLDRNGDRNPFESVESRIKAFDSVVEKYYRKRELEGYGEFKTVEDISKNIHDIIGIRITTAYRDDIFKIVEVFRQFPDFIVLDERDYVNNPKPNGYSSFHMHIQTMVFFPETGTKLFTIEVQIRSKSMDFWATIEHSLKYKNAAPDPTATERFKRLADILAEADKMAIELRDNSSTEERPEDLLQPLK